MKKILLSTLVSLALLTGCGTSQEAHNSNHNSNEDLTETYKIRVVNGNKLFGEGENGNVFLLQSEIPFDIELGDYVKVTYNKGIEDDITDIQKVEK